LVGPKIEADAMALRSWMRKVLQTTRPWCSEHDIRTGADWSEELRKQLTDSRFGVVCVTSENVETPWLNFEAGAIDLRLNGKTSPWLLDMAPGDLAAMPLSRLQASQADKEGTRKVIESINAELPLTDQLETDHLKETFEAFWPTLELEIAKIPKVAVAQKVTPPEERHAELVGLLNAVLHAVEQNKREELIKQALALGGRPNSWQRFMQHSEALRLAKEAAAMDAGSSRVVTIDEGLDDDDAEDPPDQDR
jgi:hypothetical protein